MLLALVYLTINLLLVVIIYHSIMVLAKMLELFTNMMLSLEHQTILLQIQV